MNATLVLNLATLAISVTALVISILLTLRQLRLAQEYVLTELAKEHEPDHGHRGLPEEARNHTNTIGLFYDDLGKLVAHGMIDQSSIIGSYGTNIVRLWDALAPYLHRTPRTPTALLDLL